MVTGCWNRRELNELAVSVAIGVDQKGKKILLSNQLLNPVAISGEEGGSSMLAPVTLFQERGGGFQEAARRMTTISTRKIYVGQMQMLIFGENFAKKGVGKVLDHISRDHEYRNDFYVVIARGAEAQDILKVYTPLEKTPATKLNASLETSSKVWGATAAIKIDEFTSTVISKGKEAVATGVVVIGEAGAGNDKRNVENISSPSQLKYTGLAVFKKDKLLGWLSEKESQGYSYTQGKVKSTSVLLACPEGKSKHITVELLGTKSKMKAAMKEGKPVIDIKLKTKGVVTDAQCELDFTKPAAISELESLTQNSIEASITSVVKKMQNKYKSDIFGFGEEFERKYPRYWESVKSDWDRVFSTLQVNIQVESKIDKMFKTTKSLSERMGE
ncbi:spore germination protein KC [Paenibacillus prosopidis]|uniref:Spore germination protein KC n=2 Tax=Paenibacillus prosopidis TaxID=630520 RepID=A0A368VKZ3_9BACL|nr:spore germination protein KC [Paenibacillus prosopidis]